MRLILIERKEEVPGVESFIFEPQEKLVWKAGQFLHYVLHHEPTDERGSDRWFTNAASPSEGHVMITTRFDSQKSSTFKDALKNLKIGELMEISDVDGDFTIDDPKQEFVFIAGGIGITPFRSILKEADVHGVQLNATLLFGNRDEHIPYKDELEAMAAKNSNLAIHYLISPEKIDADSIRKYIADLQKPIFYVSGPEPMVEGLGNTLKELGVLAEHIKQDWFPGYPAE